MKRIAIIAILLTAFSSQASAERTWAPTVSGQERSSGFTMPPLIPRLGLSMGSTNIKKYEVGQSTENVSLKGLQLEVGVRLVRVPIGEKKTFELDLPLAFSFLAGKDQGDDFTMPVIGRGVPTGRFALELQNGIVVSPFLGFGAGSNVSITGNAFKNFQLVWCYRLGADVRFTKKLGGGICFMRSSVGSSYYGYYKEAKPVLKELSLSFILNP